MSSPTPVPTPASSSTSAKKKQQQKKTAQSKATRAFLLPVSGAPVEIMIPKGDAALDAMQKAVGGYIERGMGGEGPYGTIACYFDEEATLKTPRPAPNTNLRRLTNRIYLGPILIVCEGRDGNMRSITDAVAPADWPRLFGRDE